MHTAQVALSCGKRKIALPGMTCNGAHIKAGELDTHM